MSSEVLWSLEDGENDYIAVHRVLGSLGLVDALEEDVIPRREYPEDDKTIFRSAD